MSLPEKKNLLNLLSWCVKGKKSSQSVPVPPPPPAVPSALGKLLWMERGGATFRERETEREGKERRERREREREREKGEREKERERGERERSGSDGGSGLFLPHPSLETRERESPCLPCSPSLSPSFPSSLCTQSCNWAFLRKGTQTPPSSLLPPPFRFCEQKRREAGRLN